MPVPQDLIFLWNGQESPLGTGKMPVPQDLIFLWNGQESPLIKELFLT
ncbi:MULTISPECIES: hypothetical protein [unclassified Microcoleus]